MEGLIWVIVAFLTVIPMLKHCGIHRGWALAGIIPPGVLALPWWMSIKLQDMEEW